MLRTTTLATYFGPKKDSFVVRLEYDLNELRVHIEFPSASKTLMVTFEDPSGFRVLDESNLDEFWGEGRSPGWLWKVEAGGWLDQERQKPQFIREMLVGEEYLVLGDDDCVSVICLNPPRIAEAV